MDGGGSSSHGYADASTLPGDAVSYMFRDGEPGNIVSFLYPLGGGQVYYSTIPLDFYLDGENPAAFRNLYAPDIFPLSAAVPEAGTWAAGAGLAGLALAGWVRRRLVL